MHSAQEIITYLNNYIGQLGADNDQMFQDAISIIYKSTAIQANEPLTLAELKKMAGQPVWVKVIAHTNFADPADDFDGWGLCRTSWVRVWDGKRADLVHIDYHFENYGKEWVAYRYQPKEADIPAVDIATSSTSEADKWFQAIIAERERQDKKWGYPQKNTFCEWSSILAEETGELAKELNELNFGRGDLKRMEVEAIQVAAVAFAILEQSATAAEVTKQAALDRQGTAKPLSAKELWESMGFPADYIPLTMQVRPYMVDERSYSHILKSLMKACCLYVLMSHDYADEQKNIGSVYAILQSPMGESYLDAMFDPSVLTEDEMLCFYAYQVFRAGTPDMRAQVLAEARIEACACLEQHKTVGCDHNCLQCKRIKRITKEAYAEAVEVVKAQKAKQERSAAALDRLPQQESKTRAESKTAKSGFLEPINEIGIIMLLKACILYVLLNHGDHPEDEKVIGEAFDLLTNPSGEAFLDALFDDEKMPYYSSYLVFKQASPNLRGNIWSRVAMLAAVCVERVKTVGCKHDCLHCDLINGTGLAAYEQIIKGMVLSAYEQAIKVYNTYKAKHEKDIDAVLGKAGDQTI